MFRLICIRLQSAVTATINLLPKLEGQSNNGLTPYDLYVRAINEDLLGPMRTDGNISESVLGEVKLVFLALPADIQVSLISFLQPMSVHFVHGIDNLWSFRRAFC